MILPSPLPCRLFLFDLDGTLIDSNADIASAVNLALGRMNMRPLPESQISEFVGDGVQKLIERSLRKAANRQPEDALIQEGVAFFRDEYGDHLLDRTCLYADVEGGLNSLPWARFAVVSNKPEHFCRRILEGLGVADRFCAILGGDSTGRRKPDPLSLLAAMDYCGAAPFETAMVGDSAVDIAAGRGAGVITCGVARGFRPKEQLEAAGCNLIIERLTELSKFFCP
jgi:phosphoglycolate phosphatase